MYEGILSLIKCITLAKSVLMQGMSNLKFAAKHNLR